jgi:hypothetical protein
MTAYVHAYVDSQRQTPRNFSLCLHASCPRLRVCSSPMHAATRGRTHLGGGHPEGELVVCGAQRDDLPWNRRQSHLASSHTCHTRRQGQAASVRGCKLLKSIAPGPRHGPSHACAATTIKRGRASLLPPSPPPLADPLRARPAPTLEGVCFGLQRAPRQHALQVGPHKGVRARPQLPGRVAGEGSGPSGCNGADKAPWLLGNAALSLHYRPKTAPSQCCKHPVAFYNMASWTQPPTYLSTSGHPPTHPTHPLRLSPVLLHHGLQLVLRLCQ